MSPKKSNQVASLEGHAESRPTNNNKTQIAITDGGNKILQKHNEKNASEMEYIEVEVNVSEFKHFSNRFV